MNQVQLLLSPDDIAFCGGYFYAKCFSADRNYRKAAIENFGTLYQLLNDSQKDEMDEAKEMMDAFHDRTPEEKIEILADLNNVIKRFSGDAEQ